MRSGTGRALLLHLAVLAVLFGLQFVLPDYHHRSFARILVLVFRPQGLFGRSAA